jgi:hypothetical protein
VQITLFSAAFQTVMKKSKKPLPDGHGSEALCLLAMGCGVPRVMGFPFSSASGYFQINRARRPADSNHLAPASENPPGLLGVRLQLAFASTALGGRTSKGTTVLTSMTIARMVMAP